MTKYLSSNNTFVEKGNRWSNSIQQQAKPQLPKNYVKGGLPIKYMCTKLRSNSSMSKADPQSLDYRFGGGDEGVFILPAKTPLTDPKDLVKVFGYPRNFLERYTQGSILGEGSFGVVRKCIVQGTNEAFAVKSIPKTPRRQPSTPRYLLKLRQEVEAMQQLSGSLNSVFLKDVFEDDHHVHIVMELCEGGSLLDRIQNVQLSERYIAKQIRAITRFISQCHSKGILYRDIKAENFLYINNEPKSPLKATDFGLSVIKHTSDQQLRQRSGTPAYMAPEVLLQCYDEKCDMWSIGILSYLMLTGRFAYMTDKDINEATLQEVWKCILQKPINFSTPLLDNVSQQGQDFLRQCLQKLPNKRISSWEALKHPWLLPNNKQIPNDPLKGATVQRIQRFATYGFLKQMVLKLVLNEMQSEGMNYFGMEEISQFMGDLYSEELNQKNEEIDLEQFRAAFKTRGYKIDEKELEHLMQRIATENDGKVRFRDLQAVMIDWDEILVQESRWHQWAEKVFYKLDLDGDGYISLDELVLKLQDQSQYLNELQNDKNSIDHNNYQTSMAKMLLREADANNDGLIELQEFFNLLQDPQKFPDSLEQYDPRVESIDIPEYDTSSLI